jgi:ABC-type Fe3+-hydroxamate transport system, periplasmic component
MKLHYRLPLFFLLTLCASVPASADTASEAAKSNKETVLAFAEKPARRIVSLSPAATEILCAVGAFSQIAACTDFCDYPRNVKTLPTVGGFDGKTLSIEKILSFKPDLVYATRGMHDYLVGTLRSYGIRVYVSDASHVSDVLAEIGDMGTVTGHTAEGLAVQKHIMSVLDAVRVKVQGKKTPSVYWEIWNAPYMSAGKESFMNDLVSQAGGTNIFGDMEQAYPLVSEETIVTRNPDVIIIPDMEKQTLQSIQQRSGWNTIHAVQNGRVVFINADVTARPGPRIADAVLMLAKAIHSDLSFDGIR